MRAPSYFEGIDEVEILQKLIQLVKETFLLWNERWLGFSWRHYFFNHTQRVRALSLKIGRKENADLKKLEYAAILHDVTKRYDGKNGKIGDKIPKALTLILFKKLADCWHKAC